MQKQYRYKRENNADTFYKGHRHCNVSEKKENTVYFKEETAADAEKKQHNFHPFHPWQRYCLTYRFMEEAVTLYLEFSTEIKPNSVLISAPTRDLKDKENAAALVSKL